ncbi:kinase-like domain-containing protein [Mycena epipterygia]|nr:kinase-like domain-containing protein [Mycena epipterygia]
MGNAVSKASRCFPSAAKRAPLSMPNLQHPPSANYDVPAMLRTALPRPEALVDTAAPSHTNPSFWGSYQWKPVKVHGFTTRIRPSGLQWVRKLGEGGQGEVGKVLFGGVALAVKRIKKHRQILPESGIPGRVVKYSTGLWRSCCTEIRVHLLMGDHPAFPRLYGVFHGRNHFYLAMDCGVKSFRHAKITSRAKALWYFRQLVTGVQDLHRRGIVHLDLKPDNLVLKSDGDIAIIDFGLAIIPSQNPSKTRYPLWHALREEGSRCFPMLWAGRDNPHSFMASGGTPGYWSPLVELGQLCSYGADLWAVGVILHKCLTGRRPKTYMDTGGTLVWEPDPQHQLSLVHRDFVHRVLRLHLPLAFKSHFLNCSFYPTRSRTDLNHMQNSRPTQSGMKSDFPVHRLGRLSSLAVCAAGSMWDGSSCIDVGPA